MLKNLLGESVAVVASWDIATSTTGGNIEFDYLNEDLTQIDYPFTVTNNSNVTAQFDIKVKFPSAIPSNITMILVDENGNNIEASTSDNLTYTFQDLTNVYEGETKSYKLRFTANLDSVIITTLENIGVKVVAKQVD